MGGYRYLVETKGGSVYILEYSHGILRGSKWWIYYDKGNPVPIAMFLGENRANFDGTFFNERNCDKMVGMKILCGLGRTSPIESIKLLRV